MTMGQINDRLRSVEGAFFGFWCPGCEEMHIVQSGKGWSFNGSFESPSIHPSLSITGGHFSPLHKAGDACWCTYNAEQIAKGEEPTRYKCGRCHFVLTAGQLQFQPDCTHALAGQTVPIPALPEFHQDPKET